jgi:RNA-directed DNA polymerase
MTLRERPHALLTSLDCPTNCLCRRGAAVKNLSHKASLHVRANVSLHDGTEHLVHCRTEEEARAVWDALNSRMADCRLELHPTKTKIVYCKDGRRKGQFENVAFDFLGYGFRPRSVKGPASQRMFCGYTPAVSKLALNAMRSKIRSMKLRRRTEVTLDDIARELNPITRGWIAYYGRYTRSALYPLVRYIDQTLAVWIKRKFKRFHRRLGQAREFLTKIARESPRLFVHWQLGASGKPA